jgi:quercetin 2,3-dioxygenase
MITLRRASERRHDRLRRREIWRTFCQQDPAEVLTGGFGALEGLDENRLSPGAAVPRDPPGEAEVVTYVREGALAQEDSAGRSGVVHAGEFQRMTVGRGIRHSEMNASHTNWAQVFRISLRASEGGLELGDEQKRFSAAERRGRLCVVASPDARRGSLRIHQDAVLYSALLAPGHHVVHELARGRCAWLHLVQGEVTLDELVLTAGDGVGLAAERAVSLTAREATEILLVDICEPR